MIEPLTIVSVTDDDRFGVVTQVVLHGKSADVVEVAGYMVRFVEKQVPKDDRDRVLWCRAETAFVPSDRLCAMGFCENDYHQLAILAAAANYAAHGSTWSVEEA